MDGKRNDIEISAEILKVAMNGARKSHIVYKANLNFKIIRKYLNNLEKSGLITSSPDKNKIFSTTKKGREYLDHFEAFEDFTKNPEVFS